MSQREREKKKSEKLKALGSLKKEGAKLKYLFYRTFLADEKKKRKEKKP